MGSLLKRAIRPMALVAAVGLALWYVYSSRASALPAESSKLDGEYRITVRSPARSAAALEPSRFVVEIADRSGMPASIGRLTLKYWMPGMFCGMFTAEAERTGRAGAYAATVIPVMTGRWVLEARMTIGEKEVVVRHPFEAGRS
ncbi:FixH family protein [Cohnella rhizosphaerae]|uniref:FixH family protein n=1 Tax=Cohnella rhizosphaerae TaxID=1457232 RepID=A0A9X4KVU9_9BACL|nr:FixH family protein [Cohnella rhizosphaerae]MDG0811261.1 FixH family protein [Cohnella rhizosphaerae]